MVPPNFNCRSISRKESLETLQKHALGKKLLRTLLCWNDTCNPGYTGKTLIRGRTSFLEKFCVLHEQLCHPIQGIVWKICPFSSKDKFVLPEVTVILSISCEFNYLEDWNCFSNKKRQYQAFLYQCWTIHIFLWPFQIVHFRQEISSSESVFSVSGNCGTSTTVSVIFSGEDFAVICTTW